MVLTPGETGSRIQSRHPGRRIDPNSSGDPPFVPHARRLMSNLGSGEILVILLLALIVLGPERLPEVARKVGGFVRKARAMSAGIQDEMRSTLTVATSPPANEPPAANSLEAGTAEGTAPTDIAA